MSITERYVTADSDGGDGSVGNPWTLAEAFTNAVAGDRVNVKAGAYACNNNGPTNSGSSTSPIIFRGYSSTIGDGYQGRTNGNGALVATNLPVLTYASTQRYLGTNWIILESLKILGTRSGGVVLPGAQHSCVRCIIENDSTNAAAAAVYADGAGCILLDCDFALTGGSGGSAAVSLAATYARVAACRINGGPAVGILSASGAEFIDNTIWSTGKCINLTATGTTSTVWGNTLSPKSGSAADAITYVSSMTSAQLLGNNLIVDAGAYGINGSNAANGIVAYRNRLDRNATADTYLATDWLAATSYNHSTTDATQANEFENAASADFRLKSTSPAIGVGGPAYRSIGALQLNSTPPTLPAVGDVQSGVQYGAGGTEFTGTFAVPTQSQVLNTVGFGASGTEFTGNVVLPATNTVKLNTTFGPSSGSTGSYQTPVSLPADTDVRAGQFFSYGDGAGTTYQGKLWSPNETQVLYAVDFGAENPEGVFEYTGTLRASDFTNLTAANIRNGVTVDNVTGSLVSPAVGDVQEGVTYGTGGTQYTGTFKVPAQNQVKDTIQYGAGGTEFTGTFEGTPIPGTGGKAFLE